MRNSREWHISLPFRRTYGCISKSCYLPKILFFSKGGSKQGSIIVLLPERKRTNDLCQLRNSSAALPGLMCHEAPCQLRVPRGSLGFCQRLRLTCPETPNPHTPKWPVCSLEEFAATNAVTAQKRAAQYVTFWQRKLFFEAMANSLTIPCIRHASCLLCHITILCECHKLILSILRPLSLPQQPRS